MLVDTDKDKTIPLIETEIVEEKEDRVVEGYNNTERDMIEESRALRKNLIGNIMASNPRGKDLEGLISLIDSNENSAHKTAATRLKVKEEDNKSTLNANTIALMVDASFRRKQEPKTSSRCQYYQPTDSQKHFLVACFFLDQERT